MGFRSGPCPPAVGLVHTPSWFSPVVRNGQWVQVTLRAAQEGYPVAELFEVDGNPVKDDPANHALERLAEGLDAQAVVVLGPVERVRPEGIVDRARLMIL